MPSAQRVPRPNFRLIVLGKGVITAISGLESELLTLKVLIT
jgi:hypothetical protein